MTPDDKWRFFDTLPLFPKPSSYKGRGVKSGTGCESLPSASPGP